MHPVHALNDLMSFRTNYSVASSLQKLQEILRIPPSGATTSELFPYGRVTPAEAHHKGLVKHEAAVAVLISVIEGRLSVLFIKRSAFGIHGGQIAFPGGRRELGERLQTTAIRELQEETGIIITENQLICPLAEVFIVPSQFVVQPYAVIIDEPPKLTIDFDEIETAFWIDLEDIVRAKSNTCVVMPSGGKNEIAVNAFVLNHHIIWGATAIILDDFRKRVESLF